MAKNTLPVDFKDDIMNNSMGGKRRYRLINNSDGTISLEDVTTYDQVGSNFGAGQMNATNSAVNAAADANKIIDDMDAIRAVTQEGYIAGALALKQVDDSLVNENDESFNFGILNGVRGFYTNPSRADDSFIPFSSGNLTFINSANSTKCNSTLEANIDVGYKGALIITQGTAGINFSDSITCSTGETPVEIYADKAAVNGQFANRINCRLIEFDSTNVSHMITTNIFINATVNHYGSHILVFAF